MAREALMRWSCCLSLLALACHSRPAPTLQQLQADSRAGVRQPAAASQILSGTLGYTPVPHSGDAGRPRRYLLRTNDGATLVSLLRDAHPEVVAHPRGIVVGPASLSEQVEAWHRAPSYLIDYEKPAVAALAETLSTDPALPQLEQTVRRYVARETDDAFLVASQAVVERHGDCTERAVLTVALARALGMPARIVLGYVLRPEASPPTAKGHIWAQVHDGQTWHTVDPSGPPEEVREYLVMDALDNEGPDYPLEMARHVAHLAVEGVEAL